VLTVLPAEYNATVLLNTIDYIQKIDALLEDQAYKKLKKNATESVEHKTVLLLNKVCTG
jgi:hypothetical protein